MLSSLRYFFVILFFSSLSTQFCANFALEIWLERRLTYPFLCESHSREGRSAQDRRNHWNCKTNRGNQKLYVSQKYILTGWNTVRKYLFCIRTCTTSPRFASMYYLQNALQLRVAQLKSCYVYSVAFFLTWLFIRLIRIYVYHADAKKRALFS